MVGFRWFENAKENLYELDAMMMLRSESSGRRETRRQVEEYKKK